MNGSALDHILRCKPVVEFIEGEGDGAHPRLARTIGLFQLTMLGVGATIGTGIFVALTTAVPEAGPAVTVSFVLAGITAALTALCYAELCSTVPVAGSSYSYAYATIGELAAFLIGACLLLEYGVSGSAVAVGWGQYLNELLSETIGWRLPASIANPPGAGGVFNLPAATLVLLCTILLLRGARESAGANAALVVAKIAVLILFVAIALAHFHRGNFHPFAPHGIKGIGAAASSMARASVSKNGDSEHNHSNDEGKDDPNGREHSGCSESATRASIVAAAETRAIIAGPLDSALNAAKAAQTGEPRHELRGVGLGTTDRV